MLTMLLTSTSVFQHLSTINFNQSTIKRVFQLEKTKTKTKQNNTSLLNWFKEEVSMEI